MRLDYLPYILVILLLSTLIVCVLAFTYGANTSLSFFFTFIGLIVFCWVNLKLYKDLENKIETEERENYTQKINLNEKQQQITSLKFNSNINQIDHHSVKNIFTGLQGMIARQQMEIEDMQAIPEAEKAQIIQKMDDLTYITERLSAVLRNVVSHRNDFQITLYEELDFVRNYIELEKLRFNSRSGKSGLEVTLSISDELKEDVPKMIVPKSFLWTYINNAILHGIERKTSGKGIVNVQLRKENNFLVAIIEDDGVGFEKSKAYNQRLAAQLGNKVKNNRAGLQLVREMYQFWNERTTPYESTEMIEPIKSEVGEVLGTLVTVKLVLRYRKFEF